MSVLYYQWPDYKLLIGFQTYGQSSTYGALCDHATFVEFLEHIAQHFERAVASVTVTLIGDEEYEQLLPFYEERDMVIIGA